jgi:hypothetical protein
MGRGRFGEAQPAAPPADENLGRVRPATSAPGFRRRAWLSLVQGGNCSVALPRRRFPKAACDGLGPLAVFRYRSYFYSSFVGICSRCSVLLFLAN